MTTAVIQYFALAAFAAAFVVAAVSDVRHYQIPNRYPAAVAASYAAYAATQPIEFGLWGFAAGSLMFALGALMFALRIMGGGDVKLLAAGMLWAGPDHAATFLLVTALAGAVVALAWLTPVRHLVTATPVQAEPSGLRERMRHPVPYGVAIAIGGICVAALRTLH